VNSSHRSRACCDEATAGAAVSFTQLAGDYKVAACGVIRFSTQFGERQ